MPLSSSPPKTLAKHHRPEGLGSQSTSQSTNSDRPTASAHVDFSTWCSLYLAPQSHPHPHSRHIRQESLGPTYPAPMFSPLLLSHPRLPPFHQQIQFSRFHSHRAGCSFPPLEV